MTNAITGGQIQPQADNTFRLLPDDFFTKQGEPDPRRPDPNDDLISRAKRAAARLNAELKQNAPALSRALSAPDTTAPASRPDPNVSGPCQVQASPWCEQVGTLRLNPTDMLDNEATTVNYVTMCLKCFNHQSDLFIKEVHGR